MTDQSNKKPPLSPTRSTRSGLLLSRQDWILGSQFLPVHEPVFCGELLKKVQKQANARKAPAVVLDLDSTLYEVSPRTHFILQEAVNSLSRHLPNPVRKAFGSLLESQVGYSLADTFTNLGLPIQSPTIAKAWDRMRAFWWDRFFSNSYLKHDRAYQGAAKFVCDLHARGAHILYLTGRSDAAMREGTLQNLARDGFPVEGERVVLRMKKGVNPDDAAFKARVTRNWTEKFQILACFENEPKNLVRVQAVVPKAMSVFVDSVCSDKPARAGVGLYRLRVFPV